jgi:hypothetical protein
VAHSAYLIFARKIARDDESLRWVTERKRRAYLGKLAMAEREAARSAAEEEADDL